MSITARKPENDFEFKLCPSGNFMARCYSMVHIGTVIEEYMGEEKEVNKVRISWELPTELETFNPEKGEEPFSISKEYRLSMHEKSGLRKMLESWRGKGFSEEEAEAFDITKLLGVPCMLQIIHKVSQKSGNQYALVANVSSMPKGFECEPQVNPSFQFSHEDWDQKRFDNMPDYLKDRIKESLEYKERLSSVVYLEPKTGTVINDESDDLPF